MKLKQIAGESYLLWGCLKQTASMHIETVWALCLSIIHYCLPIIDAILTWWSNWRQFVRRTFRKNIGLEIHACLPNYLECFKGIKGEIPATVDLLLFRQQLDIISSIYDEDNIFHPWYPCSPPQTKIIVRKKLGVSSKWSYWRKISLLVMNGENVPGIPDYYDLIGKWF